MQSFSSLLPLLSLSIQIFSSEPCSQIPSICVLSLTLEAKFLHPQNTRIYTFAYFSKPTLTKNIIRAMYNFLYTRCNDYSDMNLYF
jgi:hypothetical protein